MNTVPALWLVTGATLVAGSAVLTWLAPAFTYGTAMGERPILLFVGLMGALGMVYWAFCLLLIRREIPQTRAIAWWIFAVGVLMRLVMALSQPVLEDDWYRYLWDGAVTAHGHNPYSATPQMVLDGDAPHLDALANEAGIVLERINHPSLGTVYPPVAQVGFAIAHWIAPWRLSGLRVLYFVFDCIVFALLLALLGQIGRSPFYAALYWWNPLLVKESYNSVHMDLLTVPFLLGALLLLFQQRARWASALLAVATAVKVWPMLFLPVLLATQRKDYRNTLGAGAVFASVAVLLFVPMFPIAALGDRSGFLAYGQRWEMNDALFMVFPWIVSKLAALLSWELGAGAIHRLARAIAAIIVVSIAACCAYRTGSNPDGHRPNDPAGRQRIAGLWCLIAAALFLLSPTQFPWYFLWLMPLLTLAPQPSLLLLTAMLPLYYVKFYLDARGQVDFFHYRVVWLEYAPIWLLLLREQWTRFCDRRGTC